MTEVFPGDIVWLTPDPVVGREQSGRRPGLIVAGDRFLSVATNLAIVVPITSINRRWPAHVAIECDQLDRESWAMTEQVRSISRERIHSRIGRAQPDALEECRDWIRDFLEL